MRRSRRPSTRPPLAARIILPRSGTTDDSTAVETVMANLALDARHPVALEIVGRPDSVQLVVRATSEEAFTHLCTQLYACYPQATIQRFSSSEEDAYRRSQHEAVSVIELRPGAASYVSLRTFAPNVRHGSRRSGDIQGVEPLLGILAALQHLPQQTRVIVQLAMRPARPQWSRASWRKAVEHPLTPEREAERRKSHTKNNGPGMATLIALGIVIMGGLFYRRFPTQSRQWIPTWVKEDMLRFLHGQIPPFTASEIAELVSVLLLLFMLAFLLSRFVLLIQKSPPLYDMQAVGEKTRQVAYQVRLYLIAIGPVPSMSMMPHTPGPYCYNNQEEHRDEKEALPDQTQGPRWQRITQIAWTWLQWSMTMLWNVERQCYQWWWRQWRTMHLRWNAKREREALLARLVAAYRQYHQASGGYFVPHRLWSVRARRLIPPVQPRAAWPWRLLACLMLGRVGWEHGLSHSDHYLSVEELAALWHLPPAPESREVPHLAYGRACTRLVPQALTGPTTGSQATPSSTQSTPSIALDAGDIHQPLTTSYRLGISSHGGYTLPVYLPTDSFHHNLLAVASTGKGKSTLFLHLALAHLEANSSEGLLFMEPHGDTMAALLATIPEKRKDDVTLIDLADPDFVVGINPLDMSQGRDRDKTVESLMAVLEAFWQKQRAWGARSANVLYYALLTLCAANETLLERNGQDGPDQQYTLLDVVSLLRDVSTRHHILSLVPDLLIHQWWERYYETMEPRFQNEVISPVLNKITQYSATRLSRRMLGQPRSTMRLRDEIAQGNAILINTASGIIGQELSSLIGATIMGLFHQALAEQARLRTEQRRRFLVVIDEFQSYSGIDYQTLLAELRKYGGTFALATQSLSYLDEVDRALAPTVLSNIDHLFAFLMSAADARRVEPYLDGITVDDLVSLDDYTCYARLSSAGQRLPVFSVQLAPPPVGREEEANRLREASAQRCARPLAEVETMLAARWSSMMPHSSFQAVPIVERSLVQESEQVEAKNSSSKSTRRRGAGTRREPANASLPAITTASHRQNTHRSHDQEKETRDDGKTGT